MALLHATPPRKPNVLLDRLTAATCRAFLQRGLLGGLLIFNALPAVGETSLVWDESLQGFFSRLALPLGQPIVVSRQAAGKRITGQFDFANAQAVLEAVALQHELIWYSDGQVLHLYDASEAKSSGVILRHLTVDRLRQVMARSGLDETRYPLRKAGPRLFYVSGPANYVDHVLRLAQLMDRPRPARHQGLPRVGVVQVFNVDVADHQSGTGAQHVTVPGMATLLERRLADLGLKAGLGATVIAYPQTNSLLIKGSEQQLWLIKKLVAELDIPTLAVEVASDGPASQKTLAGVNGVSAPPVSTPLSVDQYERVRRAFARIAEQ
ncbi:type III secretion system domain protein, InvG family [Pseudomonas gessardii]|uniref:Type III secretion system domain protein, InvG family n=1 Tax=Pseudomonas gessardii TaxID=78544 RepID=A0ABS9F8P0_9PSED|nr:type III secretion system domain protein, InvG family [Pseudomonas gessardii]MCF4990736.1 type III secretion system domain protein, InvG family [Pseudomonas gessardii]MCF5084591.1 type III secretion system domain protein, InvG family [Pseudomonas gessardii]MCF5093840.1 type III secretion system domain protein, InvG family [Pseudomonas gessardii]MCF5107749.1 type III secretion system domain protein, InvG family [Pseudomonas gessardii]